MRTPRKFSSSSPLCGRGSFRGRRRSAELGGGWALTCLRKKYRRDWCSRSESWLSPQVYMVRNWSVGAGGNAEIYLAALELRVYPFLHKGGVGRLKGVLYAPCCRRATRYYNRGCFSGSLFVYLIERPYLPLPVDAVNGAISQVRPSGVLRLGRVPGSNAYGAGMALSRRRRTRSCPGLPPECGGADGTCRFHICPWNRQRGNYGRLATRFWPYAVGVRSGYVMVHIYCAPRSLFLLVGCPCRNSPACRWLSYIMG